MMPTIQEAMNEIRDHLLSCRQVKLADYQYDYLFHPFPARGCGPIHIEEAQYFMLGLPKELWLAYPAKVKYFDDENFEIQEEYIVDKSYVIDLKDLYIEY